MNEIYSDFPVRRISPEGEDCFFGYYDLQAYDKTGNYHLCSRVKFIDRLPNKDDVMELGVIDLKSGAYHVFEETTAWNFQQGALLQWHGAKDNVVFYNSRKGEEYVTVQHNLQSGEKSFSRAAANISQDGKYGLGINFNRIFDFRPGYGYAGVKDPFYDVLAPTEDGVWLIDMETGGEKLILNYQDMLAQSKLEHCDGKKFLVNHITFSPSGEKFLLLLRDFPRPGMVDWKTTMLISDREGNAYPLLKETFISHYHWKDDTTVAVYCNIDGKGGLYEIDVTTGAHHEIKSQYFADNRDDIHCLYSPDRRYIIGDCYPFKSDYRRVYLADLQTEEVRQILQVSTIFPSVDDIRCDLHGRWRPDGTGFSFDSTHTGRREVYEVDLSSIMK